MRRLIHVPIIHNTADLGSLSEAVRAHYAKVCSRDHWSRREQSVAALWSDIQKNLEALRLSGPATRIYQDGLPRCGFEEKIVRELAHAGSANHQLILRLMEQGAVLMGTEDPQLLLEEYELQKHAWEKKADVDKTGKPPDRLANLLHARDAFIARRIDATLRQGETGIVFLGALHRLDALNATDIHVETLGGDGSAPKAGK